MIISIIIPYFNRENTIDRCIKSINRENNNDIEIILIDDGSKEPISSEYVIGVVDKIIRLDINYGPVTARSYGVESATGEYVLFLDSDDELVTDWYLLISEKIKKYKYFIHGFPDLRSEKCLEFEICSIKDYWTWTSNKFRASDYMLCIKKEHLNSIGIPKLRISELWFIFTLFSNNTCAFYHNSPMFIYNQDSGNQLSKRTSYSFKFDSYARKSVSYSINMLISNYTYLIEDNPVLLEAWKKRLFKEALLTVNILGLFRLIKTSLLVK